MLNVWRNGCLRIQHMVWLWGISVVSLFGLVVIHDKSSVIVSVGSEPVLFTTKAPAPTDQWHIQLFVHPECSCTRITLNLLDRLLAELSVKPKLSVFVASYDQLNKRCSESTNYLLASKLENAVVVEDREATFAKRCGATASGSLVIFDAQGQTKFIGGISSGRSCEDLGPSYSAVKRLFSNGRTIEERYPVFGCSL